MLHILPFTIDKPHISVEYASGFVAPWRRLWAVAETWRSALVIQILVRIAGKRQAYVCQCTLLSLPPPVFTCIGSIMEVEDAERDVAAARWRWRRKKMPLRLLLLMIMVIIIIIIMDIQNSRLPPRFRLDLRSSGISHSVDRYYCADFSGWIGGFVPKRRCGTLCSAQYPREAQISIITMISTPVTCGHANGTGIATYSMAATSFMFFYLCM